MSGTAAGPCVPTAYGRLLDGLYTYCLSVLCERDAAVAALGEVRELALANQDRLSDAGLRRAWLYSLARYACQRRLAGAPAAPPSEPAGASPGAGPADLPERRKELAALAWPEAAGTTAEQREALELAARHRLTPLEVAAVLGLGAEQAQRLLAAGTEEVERTRRALAVLGVGSCPELARLGGAGAEHWREWVLGPALRRELLTHVVACPTCRGTAERVGGELTGLGAPPALVPAPAAARVDTAESGSAAERPPGGGSAGTDPAPTRVLPRFDRSGFPRHRAPGLLERHRPGGDLHERTVLVRQRALATGVLAAVLAAPPVALWLAHQDGTPTAGAAAVSSVRVDSLPGDPPGGAGSAPVPVAPLPGAGTGGGAARPLGPAYGVGHGLVAALVHSSPGAGPAETLLPAVPVPVPSAAPAATGARLDVTAGAYGSRTVLTLTNTGDAPLDWHAVVTGDWLRLSRDAGTLAPGQRLTVTVTVDDQRAPSDHWTAQIALPPSDAVVTLEGGPDRRGVPSPGSSPTPSASANPSGSASPTPSETASSGSSASSAPSSSASPSASPTSGPSAQPSTSPSPRPSSSPPTTTASPSSATSPHSPSSSPSR
ncbi:hypothetical protein ACFW1A_04235 [Kitasatospora sp. NPDC058965]|uniref:BACON domain-containing protein n=1 Tax=Kitasatospora sp. NPDC058965 TaxID=3346682 RepID=UPI00369198F1